MNPRCPYCQSDSSDLHLKLKDYFLTQEDFEIYRCPHCGLLFTWPRPNDSELGKYYKSDDYLSHNESKKGIIPFIYNRVKRVNIKNKFNIATTAAKGKRMLDFGCGVGDFIFYAKQKGYEVVATDVSDNARNAAAKKLGTPLPSPQQVFEMPDNSFDIITMWHVLEHIGDLKTQIFHLDRLLAQDGRLVIALPDYLSYDAQHYQEMWAAYDVPRHLNHFDKNSLQNLFSTTQLKLVDTKPLKWDSYYISMMSEKYRGASLSFVRGLVQGFKSNRAARKSGEYSSMVYIFERK
ncbi:MAG: class I SAM-dependent methyltransferase [Bacteroidales bacterium]|nr:class I SAM-dependent methyltransferase [Bacteroidales bacterium]